MRGESGGGDDEPAIGGEVGVGTCAACTCTTCAGVYAGGSLGPPVPACVDCRLIGRACARERVQTDVQSRKWMTPLKPSTAGAAAPFASPRG
jgi:hypothetical protein